MSKRNGYTKFIDVYLDEDIENLVPGNTSWYPLPQLWGKEPSHGSVYKPVVTIDRDVHPGYEMSVATIPVFSFQRSRRWNINQIGWLCSIGVLYGDFFEYHAVQPYELFSNNRLYRNAMQEIERSCGLDAGTAYHPGIVRAFREGRLDDYNDLSGHCDCACDIKLIESAMETQG